ncbi:hypothetical protein D3C74_402280 [compost metagenome]
MSLKAMSAVTVLPIWKGGLSVMSVAEFAGRRLSASSWVAVMRPDSPLRAAAAKVEATAEAEWSEAITCKRGWVSAA